MQYSSRIKSTKHNMHEHTFMSTLQWSTLLVAADSDDTDDVVFRGVVVCYQHLAVRFRYYDLPLTTTWQREEEEEEKEG